MSPERRAAWVRLYRRGLVTWREFADFIWLSNQVGNSAWVDDEPRLL